MRKQCKRKVYQKVNPILYAMHGARFMTPEELQPLRDRENAALEAMMQGRGTVADWREIAESINLCWVFANNGVGPEALVACNLAIMEMEQSMERYGRTGKFGLTGIAIRAIRDVFEYLALQQVSVPRSQFEQVIDKTRNIIKGKISNWRGSKDGRSFSLR